MKEIVDKLMMAHDTMMPIDFIRYEHDLSEAEAYAVQAALIKRLCEKENTEIIGYKNSMTSEDTQAIANTFEPAYGTLLKTHIVQSGSKIKLKDLFSPLIEPEIMFVLQADLSQTADVAEILERSLLAPGIEVPDARYKNWFPNFSLADLLCDNTATGKVVIGEAKAPLAYGDLGQVKMALYHNDEKVSEGSASAVLENPVLSVKWLVEKLAKANQSLKKGMIISSGTFIPPVPVKPGKYRVKYSGLGSAEVSFE